jgi:hypothetical protein
MLAAVISTVSSRPIASTAMCRFPALHLLPRVEPAARPADSLGRFDRLRIDDRRRRLGLAAGRDAAPAAQLVVHRLGRTGLLPAVQHS